MTALNGNGHSIKFDVMVIQKHADKILSLDQASSSSGYHDQYTPGDTVTVAHHLTFYTAAVYKDVSAAIQPAV